MAGGRLTLVGGGAARRWYEGGGDTGEICAAYGLGAGRVEVSEAEIQITVDYVQAVLPDALSWLLAVRCN